MRSWTLVVALGVAFACGAALAALVGAAGPDPGPVATQTVSAVETVRATEVVTATETVTEAPPEPGPSEPDARGPVLLRESELALAADQLWDLDDWVAKSLQYQGADLRTYAIQDRQYLEPAPPAEMAPAPAAPDLQTCSLAETYSDEPIPIAADQGVCVRTTGRNIATIVVRGLPQPGAAPAQVTLAVAVWAP